MEGGQVQHSYHELGVGVHEVVAEHPVHVGEGCARGASEARGAVDVDALPWRRLLCCVHQ